MNNLRRTAVRFMLATGRRTARELARELGLSVWTVKEYARGLSAVHEGYRTIVAETQLDTGLNVSQYGNRLPVDSFLKRNS